MAEWANGEDVQAEVDMQSPAGNYNLEVTDIDANRSALKATNSNAGANALALEAVGKTKLDGDVKITGELESGAARITSVDAHPLAVGLDLGTTPLQTSGVKIAQVGALTTVQGNLDVDGTLHADGNVDFDGTLQVDGDTELDGALAVGPEALPGEINSGGTGAVPRNLEIGSGDGTADVILSQDGQITDIKGKTRLNGNDLILDDSDSLSLADTGSGIVKGSSGPGGTNSIDFYIDGVLRYVIDSGGGHNPV